MESFITQTTNKLNSPMINWLLLPISSIIVGTVIGAKINTFQFYPFLLLYFFLLVTSLLESFLIKKQQGKIQSSSYFRHFLLIVMTFLLVLLFVAVNWLAVFLLLLYFLFVSLAYHPQIELGETEFYYILQLFFKGIILNLLAYYLQTNFISSSVLLYLLPSICLISCLIFLQQRKLLRFESIDSFYTKLVYTKLIPLIVSFFTLGIVIIFILFQTTNTSFIKQLSFFVLLLTTILPLMIHSFRDSIKKDNYLSFITVLTLLFYSLLIYNPINR